MNGILQAEALKLLRHRGTWGLVWIVPLGLVLLWLLVTTLHIAHMIPSRSPKVPGDATRWIADTAVTWRFATNTFGRYLVAGFTALAFAGEYGWSTWKLIVPHRSRGALMVAKYGVVLTLEMAAFVLAGLIGIVLAFLDHVILGEAIPSGVTLDALVLAQATGFATALFSIILTIAYAAAAAIVFRSTMAAVIVGIVAVTLERLAGAFAVMIPKWVLLALPTVYLDNLQSWIASGHDVPFMLGQGPIHLGWTISTIALAAWVAGLIGLTLFQFTRQDLT